MKILEEATNCFSGLIVVPWLALVSLARSEEVGKALITVVVIAWGTLFARSWTALSPCFANPPGWVGRKLSHLPGRLSSSFFSVVTWSSVPQARVSFDRLAAFLYLEEVDPGAVVLSPSRCRECCMQQGLRVGDPHSDQRHTGETVRAAGNGRTVPLEIGTMGCFSAGLSVTTRIRVIDAVRRLLPPAGQQGSPILLHIPPPHVGQQPPLLQWEADLSLGHLVNLLI